MPALSLHHAQTSPLPSDAFCLPTIVSSSFISTNTPLSNEILSKNRTVISVSTTDEISSLSNEIENIRETLLDASESTTSDVVNVNESSRVDSGKFSSGLSKTSTSLLNLMSIPKRIGIAILSLCASYGSFFGIFNILNPRDIPIIEALEDPRWIATSQSWVDRTTCKFAGMCGLNHWRSRIRFSHAPSSSSKNPVYRSHIHHDDWYDAESQPSSWSHDERVLRIIPQYVFDYAPLVHLHSEEQFWPCDIADHLHHVTPKLNYTSIQERSPNLTNLNRLNEWNNGRFVYLTSDDDPEDVPEWLSGKENVPERSNVKNNVHPGSYQDFGWDGRVEGELLDGVAKREGWYEAGETKSRRPTKRGEKVLDQTGEIATGPHSSAIFHDSILTQEGEKPPREQIMGGRSNAPAVLIVVDKGNGIIDAFWFYFYSFNLGNKVFNIRFGNHVGDWEHSMVRFQHGKPKAIYLSEHNFGSAYSYDAIEKLGKRVSKTDNIYNFINYMLIDGSP